MSETTQIAPDTRPPSRAGKAKRSRDSKSFVPRSKGHSTLTPKQEAFVAAILSGSNASDAYRLAYDTSKMQPSSIWQQACLLQRNAKVAERLELARRLREQKTDDISALRREWVLSRLMRNARVALGEERLKIAKTVKGEVVEVEVSAVDQSAANRALELLGKELRMFKDQIEIGGPGDFEALSDAELRRYVTEEARIVMRGDVPVVELENLPEK